MNNHLTEFNGVEKHCAICGKPFIFHEEWVYRSGPSTAARLFCSWSCLQAWRAKRGSKAQRRQKIKQAIEDGLTVNEICKLLHEEPANVLYWFRKLKGGTDDNA